MTPTAEPLDTNTTYAGYSSTQTINPQLLNTWRVIRVNDNGTYDAVSEYVSKETVSFSGTNGYIYYIYYLNELAKKYENSNFTVGSRYMGYNGQTQTIGDTSAFDGTSNSAQWTCSTGESCNPDEIKVEGDNGYTTDLDLVKAAYNNSAVAYRVDSSGNPTTATANYWLASRYYKYTSSSEFYFNGRYIDTVGSLTYNSLRQYESSWYNGATRMPFTL